VPTVELRRQIPRWALPLRKPCRYKGASGGRGSGKSHYWAEEAVEDMVCDPSLRFVCIREVQRSLKFSAKALVEEKIRGMGVKHLFEITNTEIRRQGGTGIMIFEGMQDHTADSIKSLEGFKRAWVEEAQSISERSLRLLTPTIIRTEGAEIWFSWNPENDDDPVDLFFARGGDNRVRVHTTYMDNPFCPDNMRQEAEEDRLHSPDLYEHVWGGGYFLGGNGRVYSSFRNKPYPEGSIDESITDRGGELLVGMDFNVNPMSAVVAIRAADECLVLDALEIPTSNTEEMADELKRRYPKRKIIVCPDPAGKQRKSSAPVGQTDFTILERAGFTVRSPNAAPAVVDRINNAQEMLLHKGARRLRVHPKAKALITGLGNLTYKEGTSQQEKGKYDHICDALGYLLWQEFNVLQNRTARVLKVRM
jgi:PBSX family phage terminase large subunit